MWYCRCLLIFTIVVRTDVMGSVRIKCALWSKLEPYCAPDPEADDWMRKAESCRLYELAPTPRLFMRPITAILGKVPMLRAGDTGTIPFSMHGYKRTYYPGGKCDSAADKGAVVRQHLGDEMVTDGMKIGSNTCVEFMVYKYSCPYLNVIIPITLHYIILHYITIITCHYTAYRLHTITRYYM